MKMCQYFFLEEFQREAAKSKDCSKVHVMFSCNYKEKNILVISIFKQSKVQYSYSTS